MNFKVTGFKTVTFENKDGMIMEDMEEIGWKDCQTATQAEKHAKALYDKGADYIEIIHIATDDHAVRYWNPREGISATGMNWAEEFQAGYEI